MSIGKTPYFRIQRGIGGDSHVPLTHRRGEVCYACGMDNKHDNQYGLVSVAQAAERLGVSDFTVRKWIKSGKVVGTRAGRTWLVALDERLPDIEFMGQLDAAEYLGVWRGVVYHLCKMDILPGCFKVGRNYVIPVPSVERFAKYLREARDGQ